jgi:hypothetical protein
MKRVFTAMAGATLLIAGAAWAQAERGGAARGEQEREQAKPRTKAQDEAIFQASEQYELRGTITEQSGRNLTIARPDLPPVQLRVEDRTQLQFREQEITIDNLSDIRVGTEVRASFQLRNGDVIALKVEEAQAKPARQPAQQE